VASEAEGDSAGVKVKHVSRIEMTLAQTLGVPEPEPDEPLLLPWAKFSRQVVGSEEPQQLSGS
jgi:hypothetical protein